MAPAALVLVLAITAWTAPCADGQTLTILHSSEHHGQALPIETRGEKRIAGLAGRATLVHTIRKDAEAVLLVDSGDILIGTHLSSFFRGEPDIKAMNLIGYQAMAAGNHEFDFGLDHFRRLKELARFPILCSNLVTKGPELPCVATAVIKTGPFTIGLISLLGSRNFPDTFNREVAGVLEFRPSNETARRLARTLKGDQHVDLVVALTHQETDEDMALLAEVPEVDVIVGGHTEGFDGLLTAGSATPVVAGEHPGPLLVKTHRLGRTLGRLDLTLDKQPGLAGMTVLRASAQNLPVTEAVPADPAVNELIQGYAGKLESETAVVVGQSLVLLDGDPTRVRSQETSLGNLLADLLRTEFGTDVALLNGGQIRDSIPSGPVDVKRVLRVLPFDSPTVTITVTGEQLRLALENSVSRLPGMSAGRFLQLSGLTVRYNLSAPVGARVREITVGGRPLDSSKRYSVATDSFLADGGDGYAMFKTAAGRVERQIPMRDLLLAALKTKPLKASVEGRIQFEGAGSGASGPGDHHQPSQPAPAH